MNDKVNPLLKSMWLQKFEKLGIIFLDLGVKFHKFILGHFVTCMFTSGNPEVLNWGCVESCFGIFFYGFFVDFLSSCLKCSVDRILLTKNK